MQNFTLIFEGKNADVYIALGNPIRVEYLDVSVKNLATAKKIRLGNQRLVEILRGNTSMFSNYRKHSYYFPHKGHLE